MADRESYIYELFCLAQDLRTRFLMREQTNRLTAAPAGAEPRDGAHRIFAQLSAVPWAGRHYVTIGQGETACVYGKRSSAALLIGA